MVHTTQLAYETFNTVDGNTVCLLDNSLGRPDRTDFSNAVTGYRNSGGFVKGTQGPYNGGMFNTSCPSAFHHVGTKKIAGFTFSVNAQK